MFRAQYLVIPILALLISACSSSPASAPYPTPIDDSQVLAEMAATREQAFANQQLAMYVLGANWCHDSVDFVDLLADPGVAPQIQANYVVQFINVGNLEHIKPFVTAYDVPVIYATPTVMVVDPVANRLLNRTTMSYWRNASNMNAADTADYFQQFSAADLPPMPATPSPALQQALTAIDKFEDAQAQRIYVAYAQLGALMATMDASQPTPEFGTKWGNLAKMRSTITADLQNLRDEAAAQDAAGIRSITLVFPSYALFTDQ